MSKSSFHGLPGFIQTMVIDGLAEEAQRSKEELREAEREPGIEHTYLDSLRSDIRNTESFSSQLTGGQL